MGAKEMQGTVFEIPRQHAATHPVIIHHQIECEILDHKFCVVLQRLLVERVQDRMTGAIRCGAGALRDPFPVVGRHAAERSLINAAVFGARERHAVVLEFDHRGRRFATHVFDRILVTEPIRALDRVVHMPAPIIRPHIAERRTHAALRCDRMAARRKDFGDAGGRQPFCRHTKRGTQTGATRANHDHIVLMFYQGIRACHGLIHAYRNLED